MAAPVKSLHMETRDFGSVKMASVMMNGFRNTQEDRHFVQQLTDTQMLAGVFDGHGGYQAAEFACSCIKRKVTNVTGVNWKDLFAQVDAECEQYFDNQEEEEERQRHQQQQEQSSSSSSSSRAIAINHQNESTEDAGTTAAVVAIDLHDQHSDTATVTVSHVGDTKILILDSQEPPPSFSSSSSSSCWGGGGCGSGGGGVIVRHASKDHNYLNKREVKRIGAWNITRNGRIQLDDKSINTFRALGDFQFKHRRKGVSNEAETNTITCDRNKTTTIIIACDGITYGGNDDVIANSVGEALMADATLEKVCIQLVSEALQRGSEDNMTLIVLQLTPPPPPPLHPPPTSGASPTSTTTAAAATTMPTTNNSSLGVGAGPPPTTAEGGGGDSELQNPTLTDHGTPPTTSTNPAPLATSSSFTHRSSTGTTTAETPSKRRKQTPLDTTTTITKPTCLFGDDHHHSCSSSSVQSSSEMTTTTQQQHQDNHDDDDDKVSSCSCTLMSEDVDVDVVVGDHIMTTTTTHQQQQQQQPTAAAAGPAVVHMGSTSTTSTSSSTGSGRVVVGGSFSWFVPGPLYSLQGCRAKAWLDQYKAMAETAGYDLVQAIEMRKGLVNRLLSMEPEGTTHYKYLQAEIDTAAALLETENATPSKIDPAI
eukprot:TRINITY_DN66391_c4_g1_i1.p1 TRINITY_DN66391_c4_g1~~TRINITY_DN66391_c4_g1_i1.p1  ORF type:complete len:704 (-),score=150.47 TRINITY_DN66391_c4_g1_i1:1748-3697(-)